jgi:hypothetical protein
MSDNRKRSAMSKLSGALCYALMLLLGLATGCNKQDSKQNSAKLNLIGKWENSSGPSAEFMADGTGFFSKSTGDTKFKYKLIDDKKIEFYQEDGVTKVGDWQILSFTNSEVKIRSDTGKEYRLVRK